MAIRMTGINSGLDTDSIIQALVSANSLKVTKVQNKLTKSEWTQEIWKDLNTKLYSLYTKQLTKFKTQGSYRTQKVSSSDEGIATATSTGGAATGSHTLEVKSLAASQIVTGAKIDASSNKATLTSLGMTAGATIEITNAGKTSTFEVKSDSTIADFVDACKSAGLNANFDTSQKRLFISSSASGSENAFSITTGSIDVEAKKATLEKNVLADKDKLTDDVVNTLKAINKDELDTLLSGGTLDETDAVDGAANATYNAAYKAFVDALGDEGKGLLTAYKDANADENSAEWSAIETKATQVQGEVTQMKADLSTVEALSSEDITKIKGYLADSSLTPEAGLQSAFEAYQRLNNQSSTFAADLDSYISTKEYKATLEAGGTVAGDQLKSLGLANITSASSGTTDINGTKMTVVKAADAVIVLDDAELTGSSNNFSVNGLTIDLKNTTEVGKKMTLSVTSDTESAYKMVKDFVKAYNEILDTLNTKFNAKSARGYDPLTDEEKEAMTDDQVEKWETKIKDSLLRKDGVLGGIIDTMRSSLLVSTDIDGKKYSMATFGIRTSSDYTERGKLHIYGDEDDETYASETNLLKEALEKDPDKVMKTLAAAGQSLYDALTKKMSKTSLSSALTFYNDKQMTTQQTTYKKQISELQKKLTAMEDKYYKQFSAMETAMAKLNSQSSYLGSLMGGY